MNPRTVRLATRSSPLARLQTSLVADALLASDPQLLVEVVVVDTTGDRHLEVPLEEIAGRGVFTNEVDAAVAEGRADAAVHSAKDLPSTEPAGAPRIAAVLPRGDARDALVGGRLEDLPAGAVIATGAPRRRVQLSAIRPDLGFVSLRGNIGTRLGKVPQGGAIVVALAALERLGLASQADEVLSLIDVLPQVGQGVIAVRCDPAAEGLIELFGAIDHDPTHRALDAERAFLGRLGGGCDAPVGAYATFGECTDEIKIEAMIASGDGHVVLRRRHRGNDPAQVGVELAEMMIGRDGASSLGGGIT